MRVFGCEIRNIPRPDYIRHGFDYLASEFVRSGTVTTITNKPFRNTVYNSTVLAMMMNAGLGLFKDLKELRVVYLNEMEICINGAEEKSLFSRISLECRL
ncbi:MAG: hypothetical protein J3R72DRAFT_484599 [Linnemannia gamsii]|nr:MAG: hypothetical protein J3R72DRAFT_484599 [Linnemannia gamsii]